MAKLFLRTGQFSRNGTAKGGGKTGFYLFNMVSQSQNSVSFGIGFKEKRSTSPLFPLNSRKLSQN
jgi:hypothetical protein